MPVGAGKPMVAQLQQHDDSLTARLARFFRARPGAWIDGRDLANVAGCYAWRTQVSKLRRAPFNMTIENRQTRASRAGGGVFILSAYRYLPAPTSESSASLTFSWLL